MFSNIKYLRSWSTSNNNPSLSLNQTNALITPDISDIARPFHIPPSPPASSIRPTISSVNPPAEPLINGFNVLDSFVFCGPNTSRPPVI